MKKTFIEWVDPDPTYAYLHPDGSSIALFYDYRRTAEDIARINRNDGKAYLEFMKTLNVMMDIGFPIMMSEPGRPDVKNMSKMIGSAVRNVRLKDELVALSKATADQVACERFEHPATIALLLGIAAGAGPVDDDGNAAAYMIFAVTHKYGTGKPIGSLQSFSDALARSIEASGAQIELNAPVAEIIVDDGAAKGVRLQDGRVIRSKMVIATCDPRTAMRLTTPGCVPRTLMKRIEQILLNGPPLGAGRLPTHLNYSIEFIEGEGLALALDFQGIAIASGTACVTKNMAVPPALAAIGLDAALAKGNVLLSLGRDTSADDLDYALEVIPKQVDKLRAMSPAWAEK